MHVTIISDASWCPQSWVGGYGFWTACERGKKPGGGSFSCKVDSSNAAEMMAICNAISQSVAWGLVHSGDALLIQTDCQAAIQAFTGHRVNTLTSDERSALRVFRDLKNRLSLHTRFKHVKGHTNVRDARSITNRMADQRAREGMRAARAMLGNPFE